MNFSTIIFTISQYNPDLSIKEVIGVSVNNQVTFLEHLFSSWSGRDQFKLVTREAYDLCGFFAIKEQKHTSPITNDPKQHSWFLLRAFMGNQVAYLKITVYSPRHLFSSWSRRYKHESCNIATGHSTSLGSEDYSSAILLQYSDDSLTFRSPWKQPRLENNQVTFLDWLVFVIFRSFAHYKHLTTPNECNTWML